MGLTDQYETSALNRWLKGEDLEFNSALSPQSFYDQIRKLFLGLGKTESEVEARIEATVFAERGWPQNASTPQETLRLMARRVVAKNFGGALPQRPKLGLPSQDKNVPLTRWLRGEDLEYSSSLTPQSFFDQARKLLLGLGEEPGKVEASIEAAVFAERRWPHEASTASETLRLAVRRAVARKFGGTLPSGVHPDLPQQGQRAGLSLWLNGEQPNLKPSLLPQIRILLREVVGLKETEAEALLQSALNE
jgi:hypothetical protein